MSILRTRTLSKRAFQFNVKPTASRRIFTPAAQSATILLADVPIEEERIFGYDPRRFLPVNPGDLLNNKYEIVTKLGWGTTSTVWLARDTQRYVIVYLKSSSYVSTDGGGTLIVM